MIRNFLTSSCMLPRIAMTGLVLGILAPAFALEPDQLFEKVSPSVVTVVALHDDAGNSFGFGSGVVIGPQTVITNCHVLQKGKKIIVKTGQDIHSATLQYPDVPRDLCQLTVPTLVAPAAELGSVHTLKVGQRVYAIGNPRQLELSLSDGLISALRDIKDGAPLIQTTTPISPGSSGGGLFDSNGRLIGITTGAKRDSQNLNFAHPVDWIAEVPERAKAQIAKYRESRTATAAKLRPAPAAPAQSRPPATAATEPRPSEKPITDAEFGNLFRSGRILRITEGRGLERLVFHSNSNVDAYFNQNHRTGTYSLQPEASKLCMHFFSGPYNRSMSTYEDCYVVSRINGRQYRFKAADSSGFIAEF